WVEAGELCHPPRKLNRFHDRSLMLGKITIQFRPLQQITQTEPFLKGSRCDVLQGYYFAKPMKYEALEVFLRGKRIGLL
ncbi:hypothetical protein, partial [Ectopseudomonas oleovorans]|uniref:hypothetical protein n=1 Tax=Ectopseudomonas oleovorans TaxID=301 RepID=UPI001B800B21